MFDNINGMYTVCVRACKYLYVNVRASVLGMRVRVWHMRACKQRVYHVDKPLWKSQGEGLKTMQIAKRYGRNTGGEVVKRSKKAP